jgi:hypothetical protein
VKRTLDLSSGLSGAHRILKYWARCFEPERKRPVTPIAAISSPLLRTHVEIIDESESHLRFLLCLGSTVSIYIRAIRFVARNLSLPLRSPGP